VGAGVLVREHECYAGGGCVRTGLRTGGCGRLLREAARVALQRAKHTPPKLSTSARLHRVAQTPLPLWSHTSFPAPLEGDLPALPARSTSVTQHRNTDTSRAPSTHVELHRSKQAMSTPSAAAEPHAPTTAATDKDAAEALRGEVARVGDSDRADAPVERALMDG
jgi:hypothetical protein